ncbi:MAG: Zn-binding domain-containing protein, partial [Candidatus Thorarchaeota archaeon]
LPTMSARRTNSITCEQEERARLGYSITCHYSPNSQNMEGLSATCEADLELEMTYEHNGRVVILNRGGRVRRGSEITTTRGFYFCGACKRWLRGKDALTKHLTRDEKGSCEKGAKEEDIVRDVWLFVEGFHDVVTIKLKHPDDVPVENLDIYYTSLKEAILQGLLLAFSLDDDEVDAFLTPVPGEDAQQIVLFETDEGGVGVLSSLLDNDVFSTIIMKALDVIHVEDIHTLRESSDSCEKSCYNCLLRYSNQMEHNLLDRIIIKPTLIRMLNCKFAHDSAALGASLDSLIVECESQLEKHTIEKIADEGLPLPTQAQKTIYEGDEPITRADFYYESKKLCVFVDGPPHESERVSKQDREKRKRIRGMGYSVIEMKGPEDVDKLRRYLGI